MAKEDQQASRAASRFPLPAGVRCKAAVEKPANNGPGAQVPGWTLRGGERLGGRRRGQDRVGWGKERGKKERRKERREGGSEEREGEREGERERLIPCGILRMAAVPLFLQLSEKFSHHKQDTEA